MMMMMRGLLMLMVWSVKCLCVCMIVVFASSDHLKRESALLRPAHRHWSLCLLTLLVIPPTDTFTVRCHYPSKTGTIN